MVISCLCPVADANPPGCPCLRICGTCFCCYARDSTNLYQSKQRAKTLGSESLTLANRRVIKGMEHPLGNPEVESLEDRSKA